MADTYDVLIIGAGPGGYVTAIRAAQLGFKTAVVDREHLGGICLNWGCIPTKALLRSAEIYHYMQHAGDYGLSAKEVSFDTAAIVKRSRGVSGKLNGGVGHLLKKNKVDVIWGEATVDSVAKGNGAGQVTVKETTRAPAPKGALAAGTYSAKHIIVATGARPRAIPGIEPDKKLIWTYYEAMVPETMPKSLLVMGSGAIGIEFASFYRTMGAEVTVVELLPQILAGGGSGDRRHRAQALREAGHQDPHRRQGDEGREGRQLRHRHDRGRRRQDAADHGREADLRRRRRRQCRGARSRTAWREVRKGLHRRHRRPTAAPACAGVYAIGDVAGPPMLAHKAEHEGVICVESHQGSAQPHALDRAKIPGCTYCQPQIASVGLTEAKAKEQGFAVKVGRFPFAGNGKAIALGEPDGLIKTVFDAKTGQLLGAHMVGAEVTELIQGYVVAMNLETTEEDLMHTVFPHPTLSEMMHESVLDAYGKVIHT